jgi:hypothetical protein
MKNLSKPKNILYLTKKDLKFTKSIINLKTKFFTTNISLNNLDLGKNLNLGLQENEKGNTVKQYFSIFNQPHLLILEF